MPRAYIGIGSNLGDRLGYIARSREALSHLPRTIMLAFSSVHETEPVGPAGQGRYLNAAAAVETQLTPAELLSHLREIERMCGRERRERWGPRTLDLDLLLYNGLIIDAPGLRVPHPRMHERSFVLDPLCEIAPDAIHPLLRRPIRELRDGLQGASSET